VRIRRLREWLDHPAPDAAELVLDQCGKLNWVRCSSVTLDEGVELAVYLQLHDGTGVALADAAAQVRFAYRNYLPRSLTFTRSVSSSSGQVDGHDAAKELAILSADDTPRYYRAGRPDDAVAVRPGDGTPEVSAAVAFTTPRNFLRDDIETLTVGWPPRGAESRCPCCGGLFPM
jgi:hypothetical protein